MTARLVLQELWLELTCDEESFSSRLWAELTLANELDAELFRWRAIRLSTSWASRLGRKPRRSDLYLVEAEIAHAHGFKDWSQLRRAVEDASPPWSAFAAYRDELALAKGVRESWFNGAFPVGSSSLTALPTV